MLKKGFFPVLYFVMVVLAVVIGVRSLRELQRATVVIEWSTASELETAGFNVYRSDRVDGQYQQVNQALIPAAPDPLIGGSYQYEDRDVQPGKTYYYLLEDVEFNGRTDRHGPIVVAAQRSGLLEFGLALLLAVVGLAGFSVWFRGRQV